MCPVAGRVIGAPELEALTDASLDGWLTEGRFARAFSEAFAQGGGPLADASSSVSGSQANLLAIAATTSHLHERPLQAGDEVITPALGFSTTVGPLYQYGLVPVYVDVELDTFNPTVDAIAAAISDRTRAILVAHCLGNPFDVEGVAELCREHDLVLIEDCCDALGSTYAGKPVGSFGQAATFSFYPAHHMTTGEGGAVVADDPDLAARHRLAARVGPRLLVPPGRERRLRQALRRALRRAARRIRPQVRVLARGLQLQGHGHAGVAGNGAARPARGLRRPAPAQLRPPPGGALAARGQAGAPTCARRRPTRPGSATRSPSATAAPTTGATFSASCSRGRSTTG